MARKSKPAARREILCPRCDTPFEVSAKTQSTMCPGCNKIVKTGDEKIKAYCARQELFTEGRVEITKKGHVIAEVRVCSLAVDGEVKGAVRARESVSIGKHGKIFGNLTTPTLSMKLGGQLVGFCRVGIPEEKPEQPPKPPEKAQKPELRPAAMPVKPRPGPQEETSKAKPAEKPSKTKPKRRHVRSSKAVS